MSDRRWQSAVEVALEQEERRLLLDTAAEASARVLRFLSGRLCSAQESEKRKAVWGLGVVAADRQLVGPVRATEMLRRFFWALNDESGAVPFGLPEAIGEILAVREELQEPFLPMLCSLLTGEETSQTGAVERGVMWALGRVGAPVARCSKEAVEALAAAAKSHPDPQTREVAARSLKMILDPGESATA